MKVPCENIEDFGKLHLDWKTVKSLEKQYMREQVRRAGTPGPKVLDIDEVSLRKRHIYWIVVSDLERLRPIWFGGKDRSEASLDLSFEWLGPILASQGSNLHITFIMDTNFYPLDREKILYLIRFLA